MDCTGVDLVGYHLAAVDDAERDAIEAHLVACAACLKTYLAIKRASDRADKERPSPAVRERLRAEVARSFKKPEQRSNVALFARRIPLYQGVALAALAASVALIAPNVVRRVSQSSVGSGAPTIDTSRTRAESSHFY
jgi:hypothetical protein